MVLCCGHCCQGNRVQQKYSQPLLYIINVTLSNGKLLFCHFYERWLACTWATVTIVHSFLVKVDGQEHTQRRVGVRVKIKSTSLSGWQNVSAVKSTSCCLTQGFHCCGKTSWLQATWEGKGPFHPTAVVHHPGKSEQEPGGRRWCRGQGGMLFIGWLLMACSFRFLTHLHKGGTNPMG